VFFRKKDRPRERFYLLPGQGGKNFHRKQQYIMRWTVVLALLFGALLTAVMWWLAKPKL
jgi:Na+-driven multidrug efflux pump